MKAYSKGVAHLFLVFVIVLIGIGVLLYYSWQNGLIKTTNQEVTLTITQAPDLTANWKTYTNQKLGFSFKYPPLDTLTESNTNMFVLRSPIGTTGWNYDITFEILLLKDNQTIQDYIHEKWGISTSDTFELDGGIKYKIAINKDLTIDNMSATRFVAPVVPDTGVASTMGINEAYILIPNSNQFINMRNTIPTNTEETPLFDQILSTFKFID